MAKMVSLRLSKKEAEEHYGIGPASKPDLPEYPYGTRIELDGEQIEALGLEDCEAEDEVEIEARGYIRSVEITDREGEEPHRRLTIQITEISALPDAAAEKAKKETDRIGTLAEPTK